MQGRDLGQFVSDFVWYLRNLLLVKTTDDEAKAEDIIDVSADNLEQLKEDSKQVGRRYTDALYPRAVGAGK